MDLATAPRLQRTLTEAQAHARIIVLDLRAVSFIDSTGIHVILTAAAHAREAGGRLALVGGPAQVQRALELTGVHHDLPIFDLDRNHPVGPADRQTMNGVPGDEGELREAISAAMIDLYATFCGHGRTTASTYINDNIVVCVLQSILTDRETGLLADGGDGEIIDGRAELQCDIEDEFTAAIRRLTGRDVIAYMSASQTMPGVECELFYLDASPFASGARSQTAVRLRRRKPNMSSAARKIAALKRRAADVRDSGRRHRGQPVGEPNRVPPT